MVTSNTNDIIANAITSIESGSDVKSMAATIASVDSETDTDMVEHAISDAITDCETDNLSHSDIHTLQRMYIINYSFNEPLKELEDIYTQACKELPDEEDAFFLFFSGDIKKVCTTNPVVAECFMDRDYTVEEFILH